MAVEPPRSAGAQEAQVSLSQLNKRVQLIDERLDSLDSMVTAVVERVMKHTLTMDVVCPHCARHLQVTVVGAVKMKA